MYYGGKYYMTVQKAWGIKEIWNHQGSNVIWDFEDCYSWGYSRKCFRYKHESFLSENISQRLATRKKRCISNFCRTNRKNLIPQDDIDYALLRKEHVGGRRFDLCRSTNFFIKISRRHVINKIVLSISNTNIHYSDWHLKE